MFIMSTVNCDIYNRNIKFTYNQPVYDGFNKFIFSTHIKAFGQLLHRHDFFSRTRQKREV